MKDLPLIAGRYQVLAVLGRGGMGEVLLAHDQRLDMDVAIKRVPAQLASEPLLKAALTAEAKILARLNDPRIVRLFDLADTHDGLLVVLEYVCGPSLGAVLRARGSLTETEVVHVLRDVSGGVTAAHRHNVIHRDLKPANILLELPEGRRMDFIAEGKLPPDVLDARAKVADFGIAKVLQTTPTQTIFSTAGSPAYMAPEQFRGEVPSPETDVYALGIIAYELLAGFPPFAAGDLAHQHQAIPPRPLAGCSPQRTQVVLRALAKRREDR